MAIALIALGVFLFGLISKRVDRWPITMPMVFVFAGALTDWIGLIDLDVEVEGVSLLAEVTLAIILFGDAVRIDVKALRSQAGLPFRLLGIALPLSILLGTLMVWWVLGIELWEAALVAAILAPTDAALGQAVVEDKSVPLRVRQGLNVESGLNDGLALPAVVLFTVLASGEETEAGFWPRFVLQQVGLGLLIGLAVGAIGAYLLVRAFEADWIQGIYAQLGTLGLAGLALAAAVASGANGFIAAFVGGLAFGAAMGHWTRGGDDGMERAEHVSELTEDIGRGLAMISFFVFGNIFLTTSTSALTAVVVVCAILALTVGRIVPVAVSLFGMGAARQTVLFVGWFGPRGLASMLFGLLLLEEGLEGADQLFGVITWTVVASVVLHGATASWGAAAYGKWFAAHIEEPMPEAEMVPEQRTKWSGANQ